MSSRRQYFQHIKEIVDWTWTLAIMCMVGYISLGQLAKLYWAMVFFGGLAASFGLFYDFSCKQLQMLNIQLKRSTNYTEYKYKLQKAIDELDLVQDVFREFDHRNPEVATRFPEFVQLRNYVYVKPHVRNNVLVKGYYRKKPII
ncbi:hypothetical protein RI030_07920 [Aphanizomenon flos-aquae NRERC-008]|jgi:hypothetical protein|uniref:SMODS and SLOG-associating 2TM effector domain-containing protein n=1 Tax=Aphanizomenon flos-aquae FACHB-1249 TaxID=2692889 RepID=A0ABR8IUB2_APHFL|nr:MULTISPECIES: hypothetical protein [Aphanizomenon]MCE2905682.1 hypothetical protein [Anabaena sp. CoA2_C59]MDJ0506822.1 hypothetical protein [Nostocales cyanobacterium LE14-WE12]MBD2391988.1 hypothetical protein [Aphanizomenon flos-aquae FACHB-1171]MBD2557737.1 hypothetical protein [Aphanizomenon flos-aquae FACHB-1290]MBD2632223.1 hypothetical protein [Aphanizomenon sp. FACHB-1399]